MQLEGRILVGIPAYNEVETVGSVVLGASKHADEVLVYDDGSRDGTGEIAEEAGATVQSTEYNSGKGAGIQYIIEYAQKTDADYLILLDADGQHDPSEIPQVLEPLSIEDADLVIGSRFLNSKEEIPTYRRVGQRLYDLATFLGTGNALTDSASGYRALNRTAIENIDLEATGVGAESEMLKHDNIRVSEVPVSAIYDVPHPHTEVAVSNWFRAIKTMLRLIYDRNPFFFYFLGIIILYLVHRAND